MCLNEAERRSSELLQLICSMHSTFLTRNREGQKRLFTVRSPVKGSSRCRRLTVHCLQGVRGVPALEKGLNPATWMLQVSTAGMESTIGADFGKIYRDSFLYE